MVFRMCAYTHRGWAYRQRVSTTCLTRKNSVFLVLLTGIEPSTFGSPVQRSNHWANPSPPKQDIKTGKQISSIQINVSLFLLTLSLLNSLGLLYHLLLHLCRASIPLVTEFRGEKIMDMIVPLERTLWLISAYYTNTTIYRHEDQWTHYQLMSPPRLVWPHLVTLGWQQVHNAEKNLESSW